MYQTFTLANHPEHRDNNTLVCSHKEYYSTCNPTWRWFTRTFYLNCRIPYYQCHNISAQNSNQLLQQVYQGKLIQLNQRKKGKEKFPFSTHTSRLRSIYQRIVKRIGSPFVRSIRYENIINSSNRLKRRARASLCDSVLVSTVQPWRTHPPRIYQCKPVFPRDREHRGARSRVRIVWTQPCELHMHGCRS